VSRRLRHGGDGVFERVGLIVVNVCRFGGKV
jgi:hypothetical protein